MKKIYLLHGSLGSGKTTLLNKMLLNRFFSKSVVIENESASFSVDDYLVDRKLVTKDTKTIAGGCICCTSGKEFISVLSKVINLDNVEKIIIESTGVANSIEIIKQMILSEDYDDKFEFGLNIMLVDALEFDSKDLSNKKHDIELSDIVLVSKADLVSKIKLNKIIEELTKINKNIELSINGNFNSEKYFSDKFNSKLGDKIRKNIDKLFLTENFEPASGSYYILNLKDEYADNKVDKLINLLMQDSSMNVKRIKGFYLNSKGNRMIVNGTKNNVQYTASQSTNLENVLVIIGDKLDSNKIEAYTKNISK